VRIEQGCAKRGRAFVTAVLVAAVMVLREAVA